MVLVKIAIPYMGEIIAPRFEAASSFLILTLEDGHQVAEQQVACSGPEGYRRVRSLQIHSVGTLICNGIKRSYRDMLVASGVAVIDQVTGPIRPAIEAYISGKLKAATPTTDTFTTSCAIPHRTLVVWVRELFEQHGYHVESGPGQDAFLVDLVASITCPVCGRIVKVAICCGAHTYNSTQEIVEFHHTTSSEFDARVYVCPANDTIVKYCREYGIELLNPESTDTQTAVHEANKLPILKGPVRNHEKASLISS